MVTVTITFFQFNICVRCVYIPSGSSQVTYEPYKIAIFDLFNILNQNTYEQLFLFGDFNLPFVNWEYDEDNVNILLLIRISAEFVCSLL